MNNNGNHSLWHCIYNCDDCDDRECEYWSEHNVEDVEDEERILDPDWTEFFNATCERYRKND